jgi:SAM-dependent methyltransferase
MGTMQTEGREQRFVFGEAAELYDKARPGYPAALVDDVLSFAGVDAARLRALEVGAGTGKATVALAVRGMEILALEPSAEMRAIGMRNCRQFPRVRFEAGTFEEWSLDPGGFGLLFSASAWHWVDPTVRYPRAAQALSPGGALAIFGHLVEWQDDPLREQLAEIYRRLAPVLHARRPEFPGLDDRVEEAAQREELRNTDLFDGVTTRTYPRPVTFTADGFVERLATQSDHLLLAGEGTDRLFDAVRELVATRGGEILIPQVIRLTLAHRRPA